MQNPILLAFAATMGSWLMTAIGAGMVFFFKEENKRLMNAMLGFASGIMIAASFWSLLAPAIDMAEGGPIPAWLVVAIGFLLGALFLWIADHIIPHIHFGAPAGEQEGIPTRIRRSILLVLSITLHNIPEGLAVGVAFGAAVNGMSETTILSALAVSIGIGLQNLPEGAAVSIPLRREGLSKWKCFMYGQASGIVEPISGVIGALLVSSIQSILPYTLAFAAGAMIYVVVEELIPSAQSGDHTNTHMATIGCILGFAIMMILDVALA